MRLGRLCPLGVVKTVGIVSGSFDWARDIARSVAAPAFTVDIRTGRNTRAVTGAALSTTSAATARAVTA